MRAPTDGLYQRYRDVIDRVEPEITEAARATAMMEAEVPATPAKDTDERAKMYLVFAYPGEDLHALRWLARRRFGVIQPKEQRITKAGNRVQGWQPIFSGWLIVYVWDIDKAYSRLKNCPGVMDVLHDPVTLKPMPIPAWFVDELLSAQWDYYDHAPRPGHYEQRGLRQTRRCRPNKKQRKELDRLKKQAKDQGIGWDKSTWENINALEPHERIALLQRTLTHNRPAVAG